MMRPVTPGPSAEIKLRFAQRIFYRVPWHAYTRQFAGWNNAAGFEGYSIFIPQWVGGLGSALSPAQPADLAWNGGVRDFCNYPYPARSHNNARAGESAAFACMQLLPSNRFILWVLVHCALVCSARARCVARRSILSFRAYAIF